MDQATTSNHSWRNKWWIKT